MGNQNEMDEIDEFFYPVPSEEQLVYVEFYRLYDIFGWHKQPNGEFPVAHEKARALFRIAIVPRVAAVIVAKAKFLGVGG